MPYNYNHMKMSYRSMLAPLKERFFSKELTCMPITVGKMYGQSPVRLMYVGRAVNGWNEDWQDGTTEQLVEQVFEHTQDMSVITKGVVEYMSDGKLCKYNYNRSPFWQLCRELMKQYGVERDWADYIAWTNLFKVSYSKTGNPNGMLISETISDCADILFYEIFCERPTHIVFVTDEWWLKPSGLKLNGNNINESVFLETLGLNADMDASKIIIGSGVAGNEYFCYPGSPRPKYVITKRPESAKMSRTEHAKAIHDAFSDLS